jgi:hypothetical protein
MQFLSKNLLFLSFSLHFITRKQLQMLKSENVKNTPLALITA